MKKQSGEKVELILGRALQAGVLLSAAVVLAGLALFLFTGRSGYPDGAYPTSLPAILTGVAALKPYAVMLAGLFILILTPVFRVAVSILVFWKERDFTYVRITALVFAILVVSFLLGKAG